MPSTLQELTWAVAELERRVANLVRSGVVHAADYATAKVRVRYDTAADGTPVVTAPLSWFTRRSGEDGDWWAPELGEEVAILSPSGDLLQGMVLPALYQQAYPAPETMPTRHTRRYADGAMFMYDREAHRLEAILPTGSSAVIESNDVTVRCATATIQASGQVRVNGSRINLN